MPELTPIPLSPGRSRLRPVKVQDVNIRQCADPKAGWVATLVDSPPTGYPVGYGATERDAHLALLADLACRWQWARDTRAEEGAFDRPMYDGAVSGRSHVQRTVAWMRSRFEEVP
ncbi:MAG: hypothetical protein Q8R92_14835 [Deltaproteobacteria bacterium]|nr:hypothetical protein [Deltaproteobacteria bacterium]